MNIFYLQLLLSFVVGGGVIAVLSFVAERASKKMAGLIIGLPSTVALSFAFISWSQGPERIPLVAPVAPLSIGFSMIFCLIYLKLARIKMPKILSMCLSYIVSISAWFLLSMPLGFMHFTNLWLSVAGQLLMSGIGYYLLTWRHKKSSSPRKVTYTVGQKIARAIFAGFIITLAVFLSKTVGPVWGGIFSAFPAVFSSTLLILHYEHDADFLYHVFHNAPLGHIQIVVFVVTAVYAFPAFGTLGGLFASYAASAVSFFLVSKIPLTKQTHD